MEWNLSGGFDRDVTFLKAGVVTFSPVSLWNADSGLFSDKSIV